MLKADPEFKALIPPLSADEYQQLETNILDEGCRDALVVWKGLIIDGHNRYDICTKHDVAYKTTEAPIFIQTRDDAISWLIKNQFGRRNLSSYDRAKLALRLEPIISARAKENESAGGKGRQISDNLKIDTKRELAKAASVSHDTIAKVKVIEAKATPETKAKLSSGDVSIHQAYKEVKKAEEMQERKERILSQTVKDTEQNKPTVILSDALEWLEKEEQADMLLTDPPYSTDVDNIAEFAKSWLPLALSKVKKTGRAFVFIGAYPEEIKAYLDVAMPKQILVWTYRNTIGPSPKRGYKLNWQAILYYEMPEAPPIDCPAMLEQFTVQDINAPDGRLGDRYHAWQKPMEIAERFIRHSTVHGETVLDPFCCTGTFLLAASKLGRAGRGCDNDNDNLQIAISRGCAYE
jgi:hypothetical protein